MRIAGLLAALAVCLTAGLLRAPGSAAQQPFRLSDYVTDTAGALSSSDRGTVAASVDNLYADRHIRLWVVYVDNFSGQAPLTWAQNTRRASDLGDFDALLAVATVDRAYAFLVGPRVAVNSRQVDDLRHNHIEPALHRGDWSAAAVAAANGLDRQQHSLRWAPLLAPLSAIAVAVLVLLLVTRYRRRRRRAAELAAARRIDATDPGALADVPLNTLDDLSRSMVVRVDNAVRTSTNELALAIEEFGQQQTEPFSRAVNSAKTALAQAFTVRQRLDDALPETPQQRRELLTRVIVSAARADRDLAAQAEAFDQLRDLVINAPSRLDALTRQVVELTARMGPSEQRLAALHNEFDAAALTSVSGNIASAKERLAFAEHNIGRARDVAAHPVSGEQTGLVDAVRAAESSLGQARALLDAIDSATSDIHHAVTTLPSVIADIQAGIEHANTHLQKAQNAGKNSAPHTQDLAAARDAARNAVEAARASGTADPLGSFTRLTAVDAKLGRLLATVTEEQATAERLNRTLDQALFTARSRVRGVSDYIDTRRGSVGPEARTRLAEASRRLDVALDTQATDVRGAIAHANGAAALAAQAQSLATTDARSAQRAYAGRHGGGNDMGAMLGGIIVGEMLGGAMRDGFDGWGPASFGGSPGPSDGGFTGGGGRF
jgi:predicted  nucleic acid-binding Zn-ribbon protein